MNTKRLQTNPQLRNSTSRDVYGLCWQAQFMVLASVVLGSIGCGNLSNDDLIFLAAIPRSHEVSLEVEAVVVSKQMHRGVSADLGQPAEYYVVASDVAQSVNTSVGDILDMVDQLGKGFPPTHRQENRRIWGPARNVDNNGVTIRLEIKRSTTEQGGPRYDFCFQVGRDEDYTGGKGSCTVNDTAGLSNLLWGHYNPVGANGSARSGTGEIYLDLDAARQTGTGEPTDKGFYKLVYDFRGSGEQKHLLVDWSVRSEEGAALDTFSYEYRRSAANRIDFFFQYQDDVVGGGLQNPFSQKKETTTIEACWDENGPGRADARVHGGDVHAGHTVTATECWNADHLRTYWYFEMTQVADQNQTQGDRNDCPAC